jgi:hypothetical protein
MARVQFCRLRTRSSVGIIALVALNLAAMRPGASLLHGPGHCLAAVLLQIGLVSALWQRRISPTALGVQVGGWVYLITRALTFPPANMWWETNLARWLHTKGWLSGSASWGVDPWLVRQAHLEVVHLALMGLTVLVFVIVVTWGSRTTRPQAVNPGSVETLPLPVRASREE